ncbi:MAG TPA: D-alanyl-D-alanine carboxypeptidase family protein [Gemmiger qucibialis]|nr:D-alanyl-D-alanine carboxypeptidase family protein [Gemmiger qucibialis]
MKKRVAALILGLFFILNALPCAALDINPATDRDFDVPCQAAILIDEDSGTVLYEKNADESRPIASITKIMTLLLTFEALEAGKVSLSDIVPVSEHAYHMGGSQIWLEPGEQLTLDEMLKAICISSANDAAVAVAEFIGGSEPVFVERMNARAKELGMQSTTFRNACGLDEDGHLSTARDVAIMSREMLLNHPEIENYCTVWMDTLRGGATQLVNTNKLLKSYNGITGLKTGTTGKAGVCISASASRDDLRLIAVVLGSSSGKERFAAATSLLDYGFAMFESALVPIPADAPKILPVQKGEEPALELCYTAPERCLAVKGQGSALQAEVELPQTLEAPIREGSVIGSLNIKNSQGILQSCPIIAAKPVDARSFSGCFRRVVNALWLTA